MDTLTQKQVDTLSCPSGKAKIEVGDSSQLGFYVEVRANTLHHTYYQRVNMPNGKRRNLKIGVTTELTLKQAKELAVKLKADCLSGELDRRIQEQQASMTLNDFLDNCYYPHAIKHKRATTVYAHQSLIKTHIRKTLGKIPMNQLQARDLMALIDELLAKGRKISSINKVISSIQVVIRYAIKLEHLTESGLLKVKLLPDPAKRERYLSDDEAKRLLSVLDNWHVRPVALLLKFAIFTGARIGEVMGADWSHIDFNVRKWYIPAVNDKVKKGRLVPLNDTAIAILEDALSLKAVDQIEVFRSIQCKSRYESVTASWYKIREAAGIEDVRVHDLRHSFASYLVRNKVPIIEVSALLGHSNVKTTMRYAHLDQETIRESSKVMDKLFAA